MNYILSQRDDWIIYKSYLMKVFKKGAHAIRTSINELQNAGYLSCENNRIKKIIKNGTKFTCIPNSLIQNNSLSAQARGLMAYFLSFPDNWMIYKAQLIKNSKEGRYSITSAMDELKKVGYLFCKKNGNRGCWQYYVFTEIPTEEEFKLFLRTNKISNSSLNESISNYQVSNYQVSKISKKPLLINTNLKYIKHTYKKESKPKKVEPKKTEATASLASKEAHISIFSKEAQECTNILCEHLRTLSADWRITRKNERYWTSQFEKMIQEDKRSIERMKSALIWMPTNKFWSEVILSGKIFRRNFDKLCRSMESKHKNNNSNGLYYDKDHDKDYGEKRNLLSNCCKHAEIRYQYDSFKINGLKYTDSYFKDESKDVFISIKNSLSGMKEIITRHYPEFKLCYKY
jgi:hypothetical protein